MKPHQHKPPQSAVRLRDLSKKDRKRVILNATVRVVIGTALCLAAPYADQRLNGPLTSEVYETRVWLAFVIGGVADCGLAARPKCSRTAPS